MLIQYFMKAYNTNLNQYVDWSVYGQPDADGYFSGYSPVNLSNIIISKKETDPKRNTFVISSDYTINSLDGYEYLALDISGTPENPITITLPSSPTHGETYELKDASGNGATNIITIDGNGNNIDGESNLVINQDYFSLILTYIGGSINQWCAS